MYTHSIRFFNKSLLLLVFCPFFFLAACTKDSNSNIDCTGVTPTYNADTKSILNGSCATSGCHDAATQQSGYDFSNYESAKSASQSPRFLGAIQHQGGFTPMPYNLSKLSDDKVQQLTCWAENGSPE